MEAASAADHGGAEWQASSKNSRFDLVARADTEIPAPRTIATGSRENLGGVLQSCQNARVIVMTVF